MARKIFGGEGGAVRGPPRPQLPDVGEPEVRPPCFQQLHLCTVLLVGTVFLSGPNTLGIGGGSRRGWGLCVVVKGVGRVLLPQTPEGADLSG